LGYPDSNDRNSSNSPVRTRTPGGVAGAPPTMEALYPRLERLRQDWGRQEHFFRWMYGVQSDQISLSGTE
jgi:hypothetical protein